MTIKMTLTVVVEGESLSELAAGLDAAADRHLGSKDTTNNNTKVSAAANVSSIPSAPKIVIPPQGQDLDRLDPEREADALKIETKAVMNAAKKARALRSGETKGVADGQKNTNGGESDSQKGSDEKSDAQKGSVQEVNSGSLKNTDESAAGGVLAKKETPSRQDAIAALSDVNSSVNFDAAKGCLDAFKVKRLGELPDEDIPRFIRHCSDVINKSKPELLAGASQS